MIHIKIGYIFYIFCAIYICSKVSALKTVRLSSGHDIPIIGLGTWQLSPEAVDVAVTSALENGYKHIDTAFSYGNEEAIGKALKKWFDMGGKRQDIFITSKLPGFAMQPAVVESYLKLSLEKLNLQYVDMYLIHKPFGLVKDKYKYEAAEYKNGSYILDPDIDHLLIWKEMEKQVKAGRAKSIGLSNFNQTQVLNVYDNSEIKPSNLQIELHAFHQQKPMRSFCAERNITITAYSTFGSPGTSKNIKSKLGQILPNLMDHPKVKKIAEAHKKTTAQVLLRHMIQNGIVVVPKSSNPNRIKQNIDIFDFSLTEAELEEMNNLDMGDQGRIFNFFSGKGIEKHPQYPFSNELMIENALE